MFNASDYLDEFGDLPPIELASDPLSIIPVDELRLIGEIMGWTAYIEADLFMLFLVAWPGEALRRRRQFYRDTRGLYARAQLVRKSFDGRADEPIMSAIDRLIEHISALGQFRNDIAHNPIVEFGPKRALMRWSPGKGSGAGTLVPVNASIIRPILPEISQLHIDLRNLAALLNSPSGKSFAIAFGETDERVEAQIARYINSVNSSAD